MLAIAKQWVYCPETHKVDLRGLPPYGGSQCSPRPTKWILGNSPHMGGIHIPRDPQSGSRGTPPIRGEFCFPPTLGGSQESMFPETHKVELRGGELCSGSPSYTGEEIIISLCTLAQLPVTVMMIIKAWFKLMYQIVISALIVLLVQSKSRNYTRQCHPSIPFLPILPTIPPPNPLHWIQGTSFFQNPTSWQTLSNSQSTMSDDRLGDRYLVYCRFPASNLMFVNSHVSSD